MIYGKTASSLLRSSKSQISSYWRSTWKMVFGKSHGKSHSLVMLGKHLHTCLLFSSPRRQNLLTDSFSQKMVLKRLFIGDTGENFIFIVQISQETELSQWTHCWSFNSCSLMTLGKTLHIHCSGLLGDGAL